MPEAVLTALSGTNPVVRNSSAQVVHFSSALDTTEELSQPFQWKGSKIYGFFVVGLGAFLAGLLIDSVVRRKN